MADYSMAELDTWNIAIEQLAAEAGLDWYPQEFEMCSYEDMLCYEAYTGMPSHYPHWSFGKAYERQKTFYKYNLTGLPYEMVINSNPCIAYLMRDNTLALQILTMAHVYAHNDFFKNNRLFKRDTRAEYTVEMFKAHADRVRRYFADPNIGAEAVERVLNAAHGLRYNICRDGDAKSADRSQEKKELAEKIPKRLCEDLLAYLAERGKLNDWERDLVNIVHEETRYFIPQIETKIMNEGWASYWHYQILNKLNMPQGLHMEFLQRHNMVIRPHQQRINPYYIGYKIFEYIGKQPDGQHKIFDIRADDRDSGFIRRHLNRELCDEMNLFSYIVQGDDVVVKEVSDEDGWITVRDDLANSVGMGSVPVINPVDVEKGVLVLQHIFDGRELELNYGRETIKYIQELWGGPVDILTHLDGHTQKISCAENKMVSVSER